MGGCGGQRGELIYGDVVYARVAPGAGYLTAPRAEYAAVFRSAGEIEKRLSDERLAGRPEAEAEWLREQFLTDPALDDSMLLHDIVVLPSAVIPMYDEAYFKKHDLLVVTLSANERYQYTLTGLAREAGRVTVSVEEAPRDTVQEAGYFQGILIDLAKGAIPDGQDIFVSRTIEAGLSYEAVVWDAQRSEVYVAILRSSEELTGSIAEEVRKQRLYDDAFFEAHDLLAVNTFGYSEQICVLGGLTVQDGRLTVLLHELRPNVTAGQRNDQFLIQLDKNSVPAGTEIEVRVNKIPVNILWPQEVKSK